MELQKFDSEEINSKLVVIDNVEYMHCDDITLFFPSIDDYIEAKKEYYSMADINICICKMRMKVFLIKCSSKYKANFFIKDYKIIDNKIYFNIKSDLLVNNRLFFNELMLMISGFDVDKIVLNNENFYTVEVWENISGLDNIAISKKVNRNSICKTYLMVNGYGHVKIGKSVSPHKREKTLMSDDPTTKLLFICDQDIENELHKKYSSYKIRGEWFNLSDNQLSDIIIDYGFKKV